MYCMEKTFSVKNVKVQGNRCQPSESKISNWYINNKNQNQTIASWREKKNQSQKLQHLLGMVASNWKPSTQKAGIEELL